MGLDVHVLTMPDTRSEWVAQRRESIFAAVEQSGYPVVVREVDGEVGHIGRGRKRGYALGELPYVTYVDADDYLLPGAFAALRAGLDAGADAVCPGETVLQGGYLLRRPKRHHLIAYRREIANQFPHADWQVCGDLALTGLLKAMAGVVDVSDYSYVHRLYESPGRLLRRQHQDELKRAWTHG